MRKPIVTAHLFPELDSRLLELMETLTEADWHRRTIVPGWTVRQVAAHLLDTALRRLSIARDGWAPILPPFTSDTDLVRLVNEANARGVAVLGQLSPAMLTTLTREVTGELHAYLASLDPHAPATWAVSWAGESSSPAWFDVARELTERWHHQEQMRLAVGRPGIMTPRLYGPVLETFMRGLPHAFRKIDATPGTVVEVRVSGPCGGTWPLVRESEGWVLAEATTPTPAAVCTLPEAIAWRVFTKGIDRDEARALATIDGDPRLAAGVLGLLAIVG